MALLDLNIGKHLPGETHINGPTSNLPDGNDVSSISGPDGWIRATGVLGPGWMRVQIGGSTPQGWVNIEDAECTPRWRGSAECSGTLSALPDRGLAECTGLELELGLELGLGL
jgi:hypothetical protein